MTPEQYQAAKLVAWNVVQKSLARGSNAVPPNVRPYIKHIVEAQGDPNMMHNSVVIELLKLAKTDWGKVKLPATSRGQAVSRGAIQGAKKGAMVGAAAGLAMLFRRR